MNIVSLKKLDEVVPDAAAIHLHEDAVVEEVVSQISCNDGGGGAEVAFCPTVEVKDKVLQEAIADQSFLLVVFYMEQDK